MIIRELFRLLGFLVTLVLVSLMIGAILGISLLAGWWRHPTTGVVPGRLHTDCRQPRQFVRQWRVWAVYERA